MRRMSSARWTPPGGVSTTLCFRWHCNVNINTSAGESGRSKLILLVFASQGCARGDEPEVFRQPPLSPSLPIPQK